MIKRLLIAIVSLFLAACAAYTPRVITSERPDPADAYVYGRFSIDTPSAMLALNGHTSMGFVLQCQDGASYILRFYNKDPLHVIKVKPSICSVKEIVYTNADGTIRSRKPFNADAMQNLQFKPGIAYYFGDFFASATTTVGGSMIRTSWKVHSVKSDYVKTTVEMRAEYTGISGLPTEDLTK